MVCWHLHPLQDILDGGSPVTCPVWMCDKVVAASKAQLFPVQLLQVLGIHNESNSPAGEDSLQSPLERSTST